MESTGSCICTLANFRVNCPYIGMVEDRSIYERHKEHFAELGSPHPDEYKYKGKQKTAKPQEWFMLPMIVCRGHIKVRE